MKDPRDLRIGWVDDSIVSPLTVATRGHEPGALEVSEMSRDLGLTGVEKFDARADAEFLIAEQADQAQAGGIRERFEERVERVVHCLIGLRYPPQPGSQPRPGEKKRLTLRVEQSTLCDRVRNAGLVGGRNKS